MDPSSAAIAFVGFAASLITLCGLVVDASKTLYELQDQVFNAPKELCELYSTIKSLEVILVEIQQQILDLDQVVDSPQLVEAWKTTTDQLKKKMESFQSWLDVAFKSRDFGHIGRKQLLQRVKAFFAEKKIEAFRQSIVGCTSQLGLLQGLIITLQNRNLTRELGTTTQFAEATSLGVQELKRLVPDVGIRLREDIMSTSKSSLQTMLGLKDDVLMLRQAHSTSIHTVLQILQSLRINREVTRGHQDSIAGFRKNSQFSYSPLMLKSLSDPKSQFISGLGVVYAVVHLPIGSLYYQRNKNQTIFRGQEKTSGLNYTFVPARWISSWVIRVSLESYQSRDMARTLSIQLQPPGRICQDREVIASFGLRFDERERICCSGYIVLNPAEFQQFLNDGRLKPNDLVLLKYFGIVTILEALVIDARKHPALTYKLCKILLNHNPSVNVSSTEHGSPLYIASEGGLEACVNLCLGSIIWYQSCSKSPEQISKLLSLPKLLLHHGSTFHPVPAYGQNRKSWSEEHGWLPKIMKISSDPEYICQTFFSNLGYFDVEDFCKSDRWLIALLCYTYPIIRAALEQQLSIGNQRMAHIFPTQLEFLTMLEEVKAARSEERIFFIGVICRYGNLALLRPFLQGDYDLNEQVEHEIPGLYDIRLPYICQAAKKGNLETLNALIDAGAILTDWQHLLYLFERGIYCDKKQIIPLIETVFCAFDFDSCQDRRTFLAQWLRSLSIPRFNDPTKA